MPIYTGETVEVTASALDFDGATTVTPTTLAGGTVTVQIVDVNFATFVPSTLMTWDATRNLWFYLWRTGGATPVPAGHYQAKVTMTALDGTIAFNYLKLSLKASIF